MQQSHKQLILTSDRSPMELRGVQERLLSRFKWGLAAEITRPDYQLRKDILAFHIKTLDALAAQAGVSKFHLSREFKSTTGLTVVTFINLCRCTEARRLIEEGCSVSEAAATCGFEYNTTQ